MPEQRPTIAAPLPTSAAIRASPRARRARTAVEVAVVLLVAAVMGFWALDQANIAPDELVYQRAGLAYVQGDTSANPEHPPIAKYLLGAWQLAFGTGVPSARVLMGCVLAAAVLVSYAWLRAAAGGSAAVIGAIMLAATHRVNGTDLIDRQVLLEPYSVLFGMSALALLWQWTRHRRALLAIGAGTLMALAILSKASAAVLLVAALACVPWRELGDRRVWRAVLGFAATGIAVCLLAYVPLGGIPAVLEMIEFQAEHAQNGHRIVIAGETHRFAPWYAPLWFGGEVVGWFALAAIVAWAGAAVVLRGRELIVRMLGLAAIATLVVMALSPVVLPHYTGAWLWPLLLLTGIGVPALWQRARRRGARVLAAVATACLLVGPITGVAHVLTLRPTGVALIDAAMLDDPAPDGTVLMVQLSPHATDPNVDAPVTTDPYLGDITAVAVGEDLRFTAPPEVLAVVMAAEEPALLDEVRLYLLDAPLDELLEDAGVRSP
ncbi:glycosyltransferase family 39 protein [Agrococcus sp. ProA11]|uniref:ArnT family glycosyltransferase n=1 Tax=Agrococcus chionoecetis TaxID=3153752 RepID=UPI0032604140